MSDFIGFGLNDKEVLNNGQLERYKGKEGQVDRISLVWFYMDEDGNPRMGDGDTPKFARASYHYVPGLGYILPKGEFTAKKFGAPKTRLATYIVKYRTDRSGKPQAPFEYELMEWQFGPDKFQLLSNINDEFPLVKHDIKVTCSGEQYQKLSFTATAGEALWKKNEEFRAEILRKVAEHGEMSLARDVSIEEIKNSLGEATEVPVDDDDVDFDSLVESMG
jgi:hypothetical protein